MVFFRMMLMCRLIVCVCVVLMVVIRLVEEFFKVLFVVRFWKDGIVRVSKILVMVMLIINLIRVKFLFLNWVLVIMVYFNLILESIF